MEDANRRFVANSTHRGCRIVVDSCSDVTLPIAAELGVDVIEFPYILGDEDRLDDQYTSLSCSEYYDRLRSGERVLTSSIPQGRFVQIFEEFAREGVPTLYLSFTAGLSRSVYDAQAAAEAVRAAHPGFEIAVLDNCTPALTGLLLAREACRMRDEGATVAQIAAWCEENRSCVHGYFTLENLDRLVAGGRVPKAAGSLSSLLDMKVNLTYDLDGALTVTGVSRGRKKAIKHLVKEMQAHCDASLGRRMGIAHADCAEDAAVLERMVRDELGDAAPAIDVLPLDPTIGAHVGPGMLALAFWGDDRRKSDSRGKR